MRKKIGQSIYDKLSSLSQVLRNVQDERETSIVAELEFNIPDQLEILSKALDWFQHHKNNDNMADIKLLYNNEFSDFLYKLMENCNKVWKGIPSTYKTVDNRNVPA